MKNNSEQMHLDIPSQISKLFDSKILHNLIVDVNDLEQNIIKFLKD